jgi:hypothetical protein
LGRVIQMLNEVTFGCLQSRSAVQVLTTKNDTLSA